MIKPKFNRGDKVLVKGLSNPLSVHYPMIISTPKIINGQFVLVDEVMYKFDLGRDKYHYAYEAEVSAAAGKR